MSHPQISDACQPLQAAWDEIRTEFAKASVGFYLELSEVHRSPEQQLELFKKGRSLDSSGRWVVTAKEQVLTNCDGYKVVGRHNYYPAHAIDVVVVSNSTGKALWTPSRYQCLLEIARRLGLEWGGAWKTFVDAPHIQCREITNV